MINEDLVIANTGLVKSVYSGLYRVERVYLNKDDLMSEGYLALVESAKTFNPGKGSFAGYAYTCIRNRMLAYLRKNRRVILSLDAPLSAEDEGFTLLDVLASPVDTERQTVNKILLESSVSKLNTRDQEILRLLSENYTRDGIAVLTGLPRPKILKRIAKIKRILKSTQEEILYAK